REQATALVRDALAGSKRVLWVANRVRDCQAAFGNFYDDGYIGPGAIRAYCYHARFKLEDRKKRHRELIHAFKEARENETPSHAVLGATTQVCEMSLDLDAEVL